MIWYLGLLICAIISFLLALRSMRGFQEDPADLKNTGYGLFLIKNTDQLTLSLFSALINSLRGVIISFELIQKGESRVVVSFLPQYIQTKFPALGLVEIEDYLTKKDSTNTDEFILSRQISLNDSFAWALQPKQKHRPELSKKTILNFGLESDQYAALQIVCQSAEQGIQLTTRAIVKEKEPQAKIKLIKQTKHLLEQNTSLLSVPTPLHPAVFEDYKKRAITPRHVQNFVVNEEELLNFLQN